MTEGFVIPVELDSSPAEESFARLASRAQAALGTALSRDAIRTSTNLERLGREMERTTDGMDRLRNSVDAQSDRLRLFGEAGEAAAREIERIPDMLERTRRAQAEFIRFSNPSVLLRLGGAMGQLSAEYNLFRIRLGPLPALLGGTGKALGAVGVAGAAGFGLLAAGVKKFGEANEKTERQVKAIERAFDQLIVTTVNAATGGNLMRIFKDAENALTSFAKKIEENRAAIFDFTKSVASAFVTMGEVIGKVFLGVEALISTSLSAGEMALGKFIVALKDAQISMQEGQLTRLREAEANFKLAQDTMAGAMAIEPKGGVRVNLADEEVQTARQILGVERQRAREAVTQIETLKQERAAAERLIGGGERGLMGAANTLDGFSATMDGLRSKIDSMTDTGAKAPRVKGDDAKTDSKTPSAINAAMARLEAARAGSREGVTLQPLGMVDRLGQGNEQTLAQKGQGLAATWGRARAEWERMAELQARLAAESMWVDLQVGSVQRLTDGFASLGAQVATTLGVFAAGGGTLKGFGDAMLDAFASLASSVGDFYIQLGIAMSAALDPKGPFVIAGGLGLKALSGTLGQKGSGNRGSGGGRGGGGPGGGPAVGDLRGSLPRGQREPQSTPINVVIEGQVIRATVNEGARTGRIRLPHAPRGL